ncbi:unnamed protein product [Acanthoscelides obtectus]|uniref:Uncharacterized protein n=1 Tax=Acanthoscelides obtectus TaxID=200917 RepID=A0A9P0M2R5_ACAOB|nr:unnamed protein product [Acanthoscelides obtectus]CAK1627662.1 hypothetical protein AOBTE_LOCUS4745 [Acanthoscelides obtectus]
MKEISALFHTAYSKVATIQICGNSVACTGLYSFNVFSDVDFAPAEVTNRPLLDTENAINADSSDDDDMPLSVFVRIKVKINCKATENRTSSQSPVFNQNATATNTPVVDLNVPGPSHVTPGMIVPLPKAKHV